MASRFEGFQDSGLFGFRVIRFRVWGLLLFEGSRVLGCIVHRVFLKVFTETVSVWLLYGSDKIYKLRLL